MCCHCYLADCFDVKKMKFELQMFYRGALTGPYECLKICACTEVVKVALFLQNRLLQSLAITRAASVPTNIMPTALSLLR